MADSDANSPGKQCFTTTHWSVVLAAAEPGSPTARDALETLCRTYWRPLYFFVRKQGQSEYDAQDLTQEFFARLLARNTLGFADRERGRFRSFLLTALKNFMADEWDKRSAQKRGGGVSFLSFDDPQRQEVADINAAPGFDPERGYDRQWAMTILSDVRRLLQEEHAASGPTDYFQTLASCIFFGESRIGYPELAARFNKSVGAVRQDVTRLRKRHRELVRQAVANTVADPRDVDSELRHLFSIVNQ